MEQYQERNLLKLEINDMDNQKIFSNNFCIEASWVIPINEINNEKNKKYLENTAIVIENNLIKDILPINIARKTYQNLPRISLKNQVVLPGLINAHTHTPMNLLKGYADDLPLMTWLTDHVWPVENELMSEEFAYDGATLAMAEMLKTGVTTLNDMYYYSNDIARAAERIGIRANIGTHVADNSSRYACDAEGYLQHCINTHNNFKNNPLINSVICPHAPYTVSDNSFRKVIKFAEQYNLPIGCHIHETLDEINHSLTNYKTRPLERLNNLGLLDQNLHAIHMVWLNDNEIDLIANKKIPVVHCPESNLKLASGISPISKLNNNNITIGLGTDGAASNNDLDMLSEIRSTALLAKAKADNPSVIPDYKALEFATINGAKVLGMEDKIGCLTIGKEADIISIDLNDIASRPVYNPISSLVYTATRHQVANVWIAGVQKVSNHKLIAIANHEIENIIEKWQHKIINLKQHATT